MPRELVYQSPNVQVRRVGAPSAARQVITFDAYHDALGFDRDAFGETYFAALGITALHVMSHGNDWFQYAEIPDVLARIREETAAAEYRMAYGSSMGGYAAARFADAIGADVALALSPQYSVLRRDVRFERRWMHDWRRIRVIRNFSGRMASSARIVIAYDSRLPNDRRHAELLARDAPQSELLALPYAGHPVGPFLSEAGLLNPLVSEMLDGSFEPWRFEHAARAARKQCSTWLDGMAHRQPPWRRGTAVALARKGVDVVPHSAAGHNRLAICLRQAGDFEGGIAAHRRAVALLPAEDYRWELSQTLLAAERLHEALEEIDSLRATSPHVARFHNLAALARAGLGDPAAALADARTAARLARGEWKYRRLVLMLSVRGGLASLTRLIGSPGAKPRQ